MKQSTLKPRKRPRQNRSRFTVEQILEAAAQVFTERGAAGGTTNHIAQRAGVSIGSLYQYFPNKKSILVALQAQHMRAAAVLIERILEEASDENVELEDVLTRLVKEVLEFHTDSPELTHVLLFETPRSPEVLALADRIEDKVAAILEQLLVKRLGIAGRHAGHASYLLVHTVDNLVHEFVVHAPRDMNDETFIAEVVTMLKAYLMAPCPAL